MELVDIYLRDHAAGSTAGLELARRLEDANRGSEFGPPLAELRAEIEEDRETLFEIMRRLGARRDPVKEKLAWLGEKLGRFKLNGRLWGYSPLSRVLELESLEMGVTGKDALWHTLFEAYADDPRLAGIDLPSLHERAERQRSRLRSLHARAAAEAFRRAS